jgi:hypothetical protein
MPAKNFPVGSFAKANKVGPKTQAVIDRTAQMPKVPHELIDQFIDGKMTGESIEAASAAFKRALIERVLGGELSHHLGYLFAEAMKFNATVFLSYSFSLRSAASRFVLAKPPPVLPRQNVMQPKVTPNSGDFIPKF